MKRSKKKTSKTKWIIGWGERKKSPIENDFGRKKSLYEKEVEVKNRAIEAKKIPVTEVNNRMDERKKSSIEKEKDHEVKNRIHAGHKKKITKKRKKKPPVYK